MFNEISVFILRRRKKKDKSFIIPATVLETIDLTTTVLPELTQAVVHQTAQPAIEPRGEAQQVEVVVQAQPVVDLPVEQAAEQQKQEETLVVPTQPVSSATHQTTATIPAPLESGVAARIEQVAASPEVESLDKLDFGQGTPPPAEKKVSALSLSSIRARKEMESSLEKKVVNPDDLPKEPFTKEKLMEEWDKYAEKLARSGFMLMSSLMGMVPPVVNGTSVSLEMPNEGSKLSFDENKFDLVNYLRKKLNNYDLEIEIIVNEEVKIQKKILDKEDKLVRFIELNPAMQYMKEIFDLEFKY